MMAKTLAVLSIFLISFFQSGGKNTEAYSDQITLPGAQKDILVSDTLNWSERLAESFIIRHPGSVTFDEYMTKNDWNYEQGVVLEALRQMYVKTGDEKYFNFWETQRINDFKGY